MILFKSNIRRFVFLYVSNRHINITDVSGITRASPVIVMTWCENNYIFPIFQLSIITQQERT